MIKGKSQELSGSLSLLGPNLKDELLTFNLFNVGIARLAQPPHEANSEKISRFAVDLYFERMELAGVKAASASPTSPPQEKPAETPSASASDPKSQSTAASAAPAASQPAAPASPAPTSPATPTRMARSIPVERPVAAAAASETETYVIKPNPKLGKEAGRLVVRFPDGTQRRDNQRVQFPKAKTEGKSAAINWGSVAQETAPGDYLVAVNGKIVENVKVEPGADTMLRLGVLRLDLPDSQGWEIIEEDLDSAPAMFYSSGPGDLGLPIGSYYVRTKANITPVKIEEGKFTTFPGADAATPKK